MYCCVHDYAETGVCLGLLDAASRTSLVWRLVQTVNRVCCTFTQCGHRHSEISACLFRCIVLGAGFNALSFGIRLCL